MLLQVFPRRPIEDLLRKLKELKEKWQLHKHVAIRPSIKDARMNEKVGNLARPGDWIRDSESK